MDYLRFAKWLAIILIVLYIASNAVLVIETPLRVEGTVLDSGPYGFSSLVQSLSAGTTNAKLYLDIASVPPDARSRVVLLLVNPTVCGQKDVAALVTWANRIGVREVIIVGDTRCAAVYAYAFGARGSYRIINGPVQVVISGENVQLPRVAALDVTTNPNVVTYGYVSSAPYLDVAFRVGRVVFIGSSYLFSNEMLSRHPELMKIFDDITGFGKTCGSECVIVAPLSVETPILPIFIPLGLYLLYGIRSLHILETILMNLPGLVGVIAYMLLGYALTRRLLLRHVSAAVEYIERRAPPPNLIGATTRYMMIVEKGFKAIEPQQIILNLYEALNIVLKRRFNATIEDALNKPETLARISEVVGIDRLRLYNVLRRLYRLNLKAKGKSILPLIVFWRKEAKRMLTEVDTILNNLGVSLEDIQKWEVEIEHGGSVGTS